jgi:hypothetical protein
MRNNNTTKLLREEKGKRGCTLFLRFGRLQAAAGTKQSKIKHKQINQSEFFPLSKKNQKNNPPFLCESVKFFDDRLQETGANKLAQKNTRNCALRGLLPRNRSLASVESATTRRRDASPPSLKREVPKSEIPIHLGTSLGGLKSQLSSRGRLVS